MLMMWGRYDPARRNLEVNITAATLALAEAARWGWILANCPITSPGGAAFNSLGRQPSSYYTSLVTLGVMGGPGKTYCLKLVLQ